MNETEAIDVLKDCVSTLADLSSCDDECSEQDPCGACLDIVRMEDAIRVLEPAEAIVFALGSLTQIGTTPDGGIIVGPQGWAIMQDLLRNMA